MAMKDVLVHVDTLEPAAARLDAAVGLAKAFDARLTGIYVKTKPYMPAYAEVQIGAEILETHARELDRIAKGAGEAFAKATKASGVNTAWREVEGDPAEVLATHARYFDLSVVGQGDPDDNLFIGDRVMPDRMILGAGRPVLVVPFVGRFPAIGKRVLVAWDAGPMAARAVHDALPLLERAAKVTVMVVNPKTEAPETGDLPGADITAHLARHGIKAEADHVQSDLAPGDMLLSRAADMNVDLIVMGAYGHARWSELVLGGVTDHLLGHMTVPVLMSH